MTVRELRRKYLEFFQSKDHLVVPSASLVPYDVTGKLDESLLFTGAGMVQFKPYFRGVVQPPAKRLVNCQRVVRTGDIESVGNPSHLTFFEMLGNFSFGDYFKAEAIAYSWEFLTSPDWLAIDPNRLCATVFEEDDEAYEAWSRFLPPNRIFRLGEDKNFWPAGSFSAGPPGPCGPNAEMFYWTADSPPPSDPSYGVEDYLRDDKAGNWLEIGNDVFIQYEWKGRLRNPDRPSEGYQKEGMDPLPFKSVDDGRGLERTSCVLQGLTDVYRVDSIWPIVERIVELGQGRFGYDAPTSQHPNTATPAIRIIADHIRTATFCIADGILPGNTGRGYVLRRLIRRAVLKGQRALGFEQPFFHLVYEGVVEALGDHYAELVERRDVIVETLRNEELLFRRTLAQGTDLLEHDLGILLRSNEGATRVLGGGLAFRLYDTYGFPLEVTQEIASEAGVEVDIEGYEIAMKEAQERSRGASGMDAVYGEQERLLLYTSALANAATIFVGYGSTEHSANLVQLSPRFGPDGLTTGEFQVCLDETPFYAESGGQVGDTGTIKGPDFEFEVTNTWKELGLIWHDCVLVSRERDSAGTNHPAATGLTPDAITQICESGFFFKPVEAKVDAARRARIIRNHTATHLLHAALRQVLGKHVTQAGSLVAPDHLRFDFTHGKAMSDEELRQVEEIVNHEALAARPVHIHEDLALDEARKMGAMALFGEKYGDRVRMVEIPDFSLELCGGCHVLQTSEIGLFKILNESSAASGVRRIEAVTGEKAYEWVVEQTALLECAAEKAKASPKELVRAIEKLQEQVREEKRAVQKLRSQAPSESTAKLQQIGAVELALESLADADMKEATLRADRLVENQPNRVAVVALRANGSVNFVVKVGPGAQSAGAHAGNLVREIAKLAGGSGGGRPDFATAGAKNADQSDTALDAAHGLLAAQLAD
ncbi:MAG: alanine--tRNA ligase [Fimbriimonadaceae bacterium]